MAKAKLNKLIEALHGEIDGLVFREMPDGSIVVSKVPRRKKRKATPPRKPTGMGPFPIGSSGPKWLSTNTRSTPSRQPVCR